MNDLPQKWCLWYHSIKCDDWSNESYKPLLEVKNMFDLKLMMDQLQNENFHNSSLFLMKQGIFPTWEDKHNSQGSCISLKIQNKHNQSQWNLIVKLLILDNLFYNPEKNKWVNGISISPKKEFNILKIWFQKDVRDLKFINKYEPYLLNRNYIYKKNKPISQ